MFKNPAAEFVYTRTYARWLEDKKRRETWPETVQRVMDFFSEERPTVPSKVLRKIQKAMLELKVLPSMRLVWSAGEAARKSNVCLYNCSFLPVDCIDAFSECLYILCCGAGVGFSVERQFTEKLPVVQPLKISHTPLTLTIGDSKEAWADSVKILMESLYRGEDMNLDYSQIRPRGSILKTMGGRASGPDPLIVLHAFIKDTMNAAQGRKLRPIECHDIMNKIGEIVVSGGTRRSSEISFSDLDDEEMRRAKVWPFPLHRAMANNSAVYDCKPSSAMFLKEWGELALSGTGERGIYNREAARKNAPKRRNGSDIIGSNPCLSGDTLVVTKDGQKPIRDLVGLSVEVLSDSNWVMVDNFRVTGENQLVLKVTLADGSEIKATPYHKMILEDGSRVEAVSLTVGSKLKQLSDDVMSSLGLQSNQRNSMVVSVKNCGVEDKVYCCTIPVTHSFALACGVEVGQCGEVNLKATEFCNLSTVIVEPNDDVDSLMQKVETAVWIGVIQSTFTDFPYLRPSWKEICDEERLLGVSLCGQMDNPELLTASTLAALKKKAIKVATKAAEHMGINIPAAITLGKPDGTVSQLTTSGSGVHPWFSKYFIRRYRISSTDPLFKMMRDQGFKFTPENGQTEDNANTWVVSFPCKAPEGAVCRDDVNAIAQLEWYKKVQSNWCEHNQSITVYVKDDEWIKVGNWVYENWDSIVGVSFLPYDNGKYEQAPYEEITEEQYNKMVAEMPKIDYSYLWMYEQEDNTEGAKTLACVGDRCELK